jgi:hypothetical protein
MHQKSFCKETLRVSCTIYIVITFVLLYTGIKFFCSVFHSYDIFKFKFCLKGQLHEILEPCICRENQQYSNFSLVNGPAEPISSG